MEEGPVYGVCSEGQTRFLGAAASGKPTPLLITPQMNIRSVSNGVGRYGAGGGRSLGIRSGESLRLGQSERDEDSDAKSGEEHVG